MTPLWLTLLIATWCLSNAPVVFGGLACLSDPCVHGVCLDDLNSTYACFCEDGYTGHQCQTEWNECWSSPCLNGGTCIDLVAAYACTCSPAFRGSLCEEEVNECESNPCQNGGTCQDRTGGYECTCPYGYDGVHCEVDISVCNATWPVTRCLHGGMCIDGQGAEFYCNCTTGWKGPLCETEVDECDSSPCQNGGVCLNLIGSYQCACQFGFTGPNCESQLILCQHNPCLHDGLCVMEGDQFRCYCVPDYNGIFCQHRYNECLPEPKCFNGGTCLDDVDGFFCSCPLPFTGALCECVIGFNETSCSEIVRPTFPPKPLWPFPWPVDLQPNLTSIIHASEVTITEEASSVFVQSTAVFSVTNTSLPPDPDYNEGTPMTSFDITISPTTHIETSPTLHCKDYDYYGDCLYDDFSTTLWSSFSTESVILTDVITPSFLETSFFDILPTRSIDVSEFLTSIFASPSVDTEDLFSSTDGVDYTAVLESSFIDLSTVEGDFSLSVFFDHSSAYFDERSVSVTDFSETSLVVTDSIDVFYEESTSAILIEPTPTWEAETESSIIESTTEFGVVADNQTFLSSDTYSYTTTTLEDTYTHDTLSDQTLPQTLPITYTTETPLWNESLVTKNDSWTSATTTSSDSVSETTNFYDFTNYYASSSYETENEGSSEIVGTQPFSESTKELTSEFTPTKHLVNESFIYVTEELPLFSTNPTNLTSPELNYGNESMVTTDGWSQMTSVPNTSYGPFDVTKSSRWTFESSFQTEPMSETSQASFDSSATGVDGKVSQSTREEESVTDSFWATPIASSEPLSTLDSASPRDISTAAGERSSTIFEQTDDSIVSFPTLEALTPTDINTNTNEIGSTAFEQTEKTYVEFSTKDAATSREVSTITEEIDTAIFDQTEEPSISSASTPTEIDSGTTNRITVTDKDTWTPSLYEPRISTISEDNFDEYTVETSTPYGEKEATEDEATETGLVTSPTNFSQITTPDEITSYSFGYPTTSDASVEEITQTRQPINFTERGISTEVTYGPGIQTVSDFYTTSSITDQTSIMEDGRFNISTEILDNITEGGLSSEVTSSGFVDIEGYSTDSEFLVTSPHPLSTVIATESSTSTVIHTLVGNDNTSTWYLSTEITENVPDVAEISSTFSSTNEKISPETSHPYFTNQHTSQQSSIRTPTEEFSRENTPFSSPTTDESSPKTTEGDSTGDVSTEEYSKPSSTDREFTQKAITQLTDTSMDASSTATGASTMLSTMSWFTPILTHNMTDMVTLSRTTRDEGSSTKVVDVFSTFDYNSSCFKWPCLNGGSCVVTENGPQCRCRWRFEGLHCEVPLNISTPAFYGHSHLTLDLNRANLTSDNELRITVEFQSVSTSGILLFLHDGLGLAVNRFFLIFLEYGTIKFRFSCGNHHMSMMETKQNVSNGNVQVLTLRIAWLKGGQCLGSIRLNNTYTLEGRQTVDSNVWGKNWPRLLYLGNIPASVTKPAAAQFLRGFRGCMLFLNIQDQPISFWDATGGWGITQCLSPQCAMHNCMHQGTCIDGDKGPVCLCSPGYEGDFCERKVCVANPCQAGGTCLASGNSVHCLCPYEREGEFCEQITPMPRPMLQGSVQGYASFISYELPTKVEETFELQVHFVTQDLTQVAVILYMGKPYLARKKDNEKHVDFLAVSLVRGHVALTWDLGSGTRRIFTPFPVNPGVGAHRVGVGRRGRVSWLQVDSQPRVSARSPGILHSLNVNELYVGGHEAYNLSALPSDLPFHAGFHGCIFGLSFRGEDYEHEALVPRVLNARNLRRCPYAFCRSRCDKGKCGLALQETNDLPNEAIIAINDASPDLC